jgi:hypothetical protein
MPNPALLISDVSITTQSGWPDKLNANAIKNGKVDMVGMTRAQIADPYLVQKLSNQREEDIRPCVGLGYCVDRVNQGKDAVCGHNAASGREAFLSHVFERDITPGKKVVVVGGGPAGRHGSIAGFTGARHGGRFIRSD